MTLTRPFDLMQVLETRSLDRRGSPPTAPTEVMVRQAEVDAAYLAFEAARADPIYQAELQAKATEARERARCLREAMARPMP